MKITLDDRLSEIFDLVDGERVADIGCDHGKLGVKLLEEGEVKSVIATDISAPSLGKAISLALACELQDKMICRVGDGLKPISNREVETVVIAGMGGDEIRDILKEGFEEGKRFNSFVLSPNTHAEKVRKCLVENCYKIVEDEMLKSDGRFYTVLKADEGEDELDVLETLYGKFFRYDEIFREYAQLRLRAMQELVDDNRYAERAQKEIRALKAALKEFEQ